MKSNIAAGITSDKEIIQRVLMGEKNLYEIIMRKYNQRLYRVGMSIINDEAEVEDVMQVAYIKAYENLAKFEFKSTFSTWITRILINESLLTIKKRKQSFNMNGDVMNNKIYEQQPANSPTPFMEAVNAELKIILEKKIRELPEKYRTVFVMREVENMNIAETVECLDLTEVNVKVRLNRAKAMLRNSLSKYYQKDEILNFHLSKCDRIVQNVMTQINKISPVA